MPTRPSGTWRNPTILVVDDDVDARALTSAILTRGGYQVLTAADGREGLHVLTAMRTLPSLILLDLAMPTMTGPEFLAVMRSYHRLSTIPVVLLTGTAVDQSTLGCAALVPKGVARDTLIPTIQALGIRIAKGTEPP